MASYEKVVERWLALELGQRPGRGGYLSNWRMPSRPGRIDSYGSHFTLVETVRDRKRRIVCFLLNGDRATMTTMTKHQPAVRNGLRNSGYPCIIIPFSALTAARIDRSTIRPLDIQDDRTETIYEKIKPVNLDAAVWGEPHEIGSAVVQNGHIATYQNLSLRRYLQMWDYQAKQMRDNENPSIHVYLDGARVDFDDEHGWHVQSWKHWLGESLFRARVNLATRWDPVRLSAPRTFVSSFDYQENPALYFLAEIPRGAKAATLQDAILALSPRIVHAAVAQGRQVKRQGDMFAIPTALSTRMVKKRCGRPIERMQGVFGTDHVVTERIVGPKSVTYARGTIHHRPGFRSDHKRVKLGKEWHLIVPNTVPRRSGSMIRVPR